MLERFFAVAADVHERTLYQVDHDSGKERHYPRAEIIRHRGSRDYGIENVLTAPLIVLADVLHCCFPEAPPPREKPEKSIDGMWSIQRTAPLLGLFLRKDQAIECFEDTCRLPAINPWWIMRTGEVVQAIGPTHPSFRISHSVDGDLLLQMVGGNAF